MSGRLVVCLAAFVLVVACTDSGDPAALPDETPGTITRVTCHFTYFVPSRPSKSTTRQLSVSIGRAPARDRSVARLGPFVLLLNYVDDGLGPGNLSIVVRLRGERGYIVNDSVELEGPPRSGQPRTVAPTLPANQFGNSFLGTQFVDDPNSNATLERTCAAS